MSIKLWQPTPGYWLFWTSLVYFCAGMFNIFVYKFCPEELIQIVWLFIMSMPLWIRPMATWLKMRVFWEIR